MREVFQFWGYGPEVFERYVEKDSLMQQEGGEGILKVKFGQLKFTGVARNLLKDFINVDNAILGHVLAQRYQSRIGTSIISLETFGGEDAVPLVTCDEEGRFHFLFDLDETIEYMQQEIYINAKPPLYVTLGLSPENFPAAFRKIVLVGFGFARYLFKQLSGSKSNSVVPSKNCSVDIYRLLVKAILDKVGAKTLVPLWPKNKQYAVVLNHDVDTRWGIDHPEGIRAFRESEEKYGFRSAWMVVTQLYEADHEELGSLIEANHEIGCHGTVHDHKIAYMPVAAVKKRLQTARNFLEEFDCVGFRSPSYHRSPNMYQGLDGMFSYDMSMHDEYENVNSPIPSRQGCGTCFPFRIKDTSLLEIPTTISEDYALEMEGLTPAQAAERQIFQIKEIAGRRGVANLLTHPESQLSARPEWHNCYETVLEYLAEDSDAWIALPRDVAVWWRDRESKIDEAWTREINVS